MPDRPAPTVDVDDPLVRRLVERVVAEVDPLRVVLFGSRAAGTEGPDSDVDLVVVVPDGDRPLSASRLLRERVRRVGLPVDYIVATPAILDRHGESLGYVYREAHTSGREVYAADA